LSSLPAIPEAPSFQSIGSANERIVLGEGRISIEEGEARRLIEPGGYAYLSAPDTENDLRLTTRGSFYGFWDSPLDFHPAGE
jgi:hypothetical protein